MKTAVSRAALHTSMSITTKVIVPLVQSSFVFIKRDPTRSKQLSTVAILYYPVPLSFLPSSNPFALLICFYFRLIRSFTDSKYTTEHFRLRSLASLEITFLGNFSNNDYDAEDDADRFKNLLRLNM